MWEVFNGKVSVHLFTSWYRKSFNLISSSIKLTRSKPYRLHLIQKNNLLEANGTIFELK